MPAARHQRELDRREAAEQPRDDVITPEYLTACVRRLLDPLGWSGGAAAGAKLARPERLVVSLVRDGSFLFSVPSSALWVQHRYSAPASACACSRCNRADAAR